MKNLIIIILCLFSSGISFAQGSRKVQKELQKVMKQLPPESQSRLLETARRELLIQQNTAKVTAIAPTAAKPSVPVPVADLAAPPKVTVTPETKVVPPTGNETKLTPTPPSAAFTPATPPPPPAEDFISIAKNYPATTLQWDSESFDFGNINEGDKVKHTFIVTNTGKNPLYIVNVKPTCGCTGKKYTKEAIAPGAKGEVEIEFNSSGKTGQQSKAVTITTNSEPIQKTLRFTGLVVAKPGESHEGHNH